MKTTEPMVLHVAAPEIDAIRRGLELHLKGLKALEKKLEENGLGSDDVERTIAMIEGNDNQPGILNRIDDQLDAFYDGESFASAARSQMEITSVTEKIVATTHTVDAETVDVESTPADEEWEDGDRVPMACPECGHKESISADQASSDLVIPCRKCESVMEVDEDALFS